MTDCPAPDQAGYCGCRHRVKLNEDGSNPCRCCAGMWPDGNSFDPDDLDEPAPDQAVRLTDLAAHVERYRALAARIDNPPLSALTLLLECWDMLQESEQRADLAESERDQWCEQALAAGEGVLVDAPALAVKERAERAEAALAAHREAMVELLLSHDNLYIAHFGDPALVGIGPEDDIAAKPARRLLSAVTGAPGAAEEPYLKPHTESWQAMDRLLGGKDRER